MRKKNKRLVGGVEFRAQEYGMTRDEAGELVLRDRDWGGETKVEAGEGVERKFAKQTGMLAGDVDRHM